MNQESQVMNQESQKNPYKFKPVAELAVGDWICSGALSGAPQIQSPVQVVGLSRDIVRVTRGEKQLRSRFLRGIRFVFSTKEEADAFFNVAKKAWESYEKRKKASMVRLMKDYDKVAGKSKV